VTADAGRVAIDRAELARLGRVASQLELGAVRTYGEAAGNWLSPLRGHGMEYDESRPYTPGDDVRRLDWRVTARTRKPYTKMFREERERPLLLWLDLRAPMFFATRGSFKAVQAARIAALGAWAAIAHGDRVGALLFDEHDHVEMRPQRGRAAVFYLIRRLLAHPAWQREHGGERASADLAERGLARLARVARPGSLLFLLSDLRGLQQVADGPYLSRLAWHSDVVQVAFIDPLERELPPEGSYRVSDGRRIVNLNVEPGMAAAYRERFRQRLAALHQAARRYRVLLLECDTRADPVGVLRHGLDRRWRHHGEAQPAPAQSA